MHDNLTREQYLLQKQAALMVRRANLVGKVERVERQIRLIDRKSALLEAKILRRHNHHQQGAAISLESKGATLGVTLQGQSELATTAQSKD